MTDLITPVLPEDRMETPGGISRGQLARRAQRVLTRLLAQDRWPNPDRLAATLAPLVGTVLAEHRLTKADRAASIKVAGAAATYCWDFLPGLDWQWLPTALGPDADLVPLVWRHHNGTLLADVLLAGLHRDPQMAGDSLALDLLARLDDAGHPITAVRLLPLLAPARAQLLTPIPAPDALHGYQLTAAPLTDTDFANIGGLGR